MQPNRKLAVPLAALVLITACTAGEGGSSSPRTAASRPPEVGPSPSGAVRRVAGWTFAEQGTEVPPEALPYPYITPTPPPAATPIDGTYLRILTLDDVADAPFPTRCLRCPPFFPHAGVSTLMFHEGRYWLNHQLSGFRSMGHYTTDGRTITLFNDPNCSQDRGRYRWTLRQGRLTFELLGGTCVYEEARARDLGMVPWTRIDPCIYRFVHLWPARPECA